MYDFFINAIGAPASGANELVVASCCVVMVLSVVVSIRVLFLVLDYMVGGRKK